MNRHRSIVFTAIALTTILMVGVISAAPALAGSNQLTRAEIEGLLQMREEEKMARDVYTTFGGLYAQDIFYRISNSEQHHMDAVKTLLDAYRLADPAANQVGIFVNPALQGLFDSLIALGSQSLADALKAGGVVEEVDILDLEYFLSQTRKADIQQVYGHLLEGSYHHLRAFASTLYSLTGETYQPQYLDQEAYDAIIGSGGQGGFGGGGGGGGGGGCRGGR